MTNKQNVRSAEHGGAGVKFLIVFVGLVLAANAAFQYVPVAYNGASFRQEMDTAVVKGLAAAGQMKPLDVVKASVTKAAFDYNIPADAVIDIKPEGGVVQAQVTYTQKIGLLPFGLYVYDYNFNYLARPTGYLLKQ